jgi:hypothetical protein
MAEAYPAPSASAAAAAEAPKPAVNAKATAKKRKSVRFNIPAEGVCSALASQGSRCKQQGDAPRGRASEHIALYGRTWRCLGSMAGEFQQAAIVNEIRRVCIDEMRI